MSEARRVQLQLDKEILGVVKEDFCRMVADFRRKESLAIGCNASFLVLIPKKENPMALNDYMPISLVGCLYKVLAKLLAGRLSLVMDSVISENQTLFLKGRNIMDGIVVVNEILDCAKKKGKLCMLFKIDFEKVYDSVCWELLDYMFARMEFGSKWRSWV